MGEPGTDKVLDVPPGVILQTDEGKIIAELNEVCRFRQFMKHWHLLHIGRNVTNVLPE